MADAEFRYADLLPASGDDTPYRLDPQPVGDDGLAAPHYLVAFIVGMIGVGGVLREEGSYGPAGSYERQAFT